MQKLLLTKQEKLAWQEFKSKLQKGEKLNRSASFWVSSFFLLLLSLPVFSFELKPINVTDNIRWTLETTSGWQNITNLLISKEDGGSSQVQKGLNFNGVLFHSFWKETEILKSQLNLGFDQRMHFLWTENPDFFHDDMMLNESLECVEFDLQAMLPYKITYFVTVSPYVGYSFIDYSYEEEFKYGIQKDTVMYNSMVVGFGYSQRINKVFLHNFFVSYSPIVFENYSKSKIQFINYGFELISTTHPLALTLFVASKKAFLQKGRLIFDGTYFRFTTFELGFAFHIHLR